MNLVEMFIRICSSTSAFRYDMHGN